VKSLKCLNFKSLIACYLVNSSKFSVYQNQKDQF